MSEESGAASWSDRLFGGFRKTSERLSDNLAGIVAKTRLTPDQLDDIED
ncbi:MAG: signal recognition particle-docking protein FtsY, partial [Alphaproteobacteria bacterium]|nr:signal recognition particle-docking protein FtsY [Alphaproteobacteria bacterium]